MSTKKFYQPVLFMDAVKSGVELPLDVDFDLLDGTQSSFLVSAYWVHKQGFFSDTGDGTYTFHDNEKIFPGPVNFEGDITFTGTVSFDAGVVNFGGAGLLASDFTYADSLLMLNEGETASGIDGGTGIGGIVIDRGIHPNGDARFIWDEASETWRPEVGGTLGSIILNQLQVTNYVYIDQVPSDNNHATNKFYVDQQIAAIAGGGSGVVYVPLALGAIDTNSIDLTVDDVGNTWKCDLRYNSTQLEVIAGGLQIKSSFLGTLGTTHNHNSVYSVLGHTHLAAEITNFTTTFNSLGDARYSLKTHNHTGIYALSVHTHLSDTISVTGQSNLFVTTAEKALWNAAAAGGDTQIVSDRSLFEVGSTNKRINLNAAAYEIQPLSGDTRLVYWNELKQIQIISGNPAAGWYYLYLDYSGINALGTNNLTGAANNNNLFYASTVAPTKDQTRKAHYYSGDDRCIFAFYVETISVGVTGIEKFYHDGRDYVLFGVDHVTAWLDNTHAHTPGGWFSVALDLPSFTQFAQLAVRLNSIDPINVIWRPAGSGTIGHNLFYESGGAHQIDQNLKAFVYLSTISKAFEVNTGTGHHGFVVDITGYYLPKGF